MGIKVIINGASGKMGQTTVATIAAENDLKLVATLSSNDNLATAIQDTKADVVVDFTTPQAVDNNTKIIIDNKARPVIGTTGLTPEQIKAHQQACADLKLGGIIAPNFSVAAILMMRFSKEAAKYFPHCEIIEMHHPYKLDAPSGTAIKTAELIAETRTQSDLIIPVKDPARGEDYNGTPIHSVRLPGLFAHQMVIFGGQGETLTIRDDANDRGCMMPGVFLACRKVMELDHMIYGLENIID